MSRILILPGGGAHGVVQLGSIQAFLDQYKSYDALVTTSVGTLNGFFLHSNKLPELVNLWKNISNGQIYGWNPLKMFGASASLASTAPLEKLINKYLDVELLGKNPKPFFVSTTQINPLQAVTARMPYGNNTAKWLLASASAPIAFPVVSIDGQQYTDAGVMRDYNIEWAIEQGYDEIVALCPSPMVNKPVRNLIDMLELMFTATGAGQYADEINIAHILNKNKHTVSLTIYRPQSLDFGLLDFNSAGKNFEKYYNLGYTLLNKPTIQYRRVLEAGQSKWRIFH